MWMEGAALRTAIEKGHMGVVQMLLEQGAEVNLHGEHGAVLQAASARRSMEVVRLLIEKGAVSCILQSSDDQSTGRILWPKRYGVGRGHKKVAELFLSYGADNASE
ncbi:hypothetical protein C8J57DRAFT_167956 [Mycena rebaudengoi]|nr:hypothetical protein C8J57DRAFT_167956 [Mycena rebaudengoi]